MTESYFDAPELPPLPETSMLLMKCGRIADFDGRDGWPDAFTLKELAALQYPDDEALRGDLIALFWPHLGLEIECVTVMRDIPTDNPSKPWQQVPEGGITRDAAARALRELARIEPSECVRAWLGPAWKEEAPKVSDGDTPNAVSDSARAKAPDAATSDPKEIRCGSNPAKVYRAWIAEQAAKLCKPGDILATLGECIKKEADERNYRNESGDPIPVGTIIKWIPKGTTGGRGKNGRKPKKLIPPAKSS